MSVACERINFIRCSSKFALSAVFWFGFFGSVSWPATWPMQMMVTSNPYAKRIVTPCVFFACWKPVTWLICQDHAPVTNCELNLVRLAKQRAAQRCPGSATLNCKRSFLQCFLIVLVLDGMVSRTSASASASASTSWG